uniref:Secreted protein n=1 Tax=Anopheles minimus TaxID=112268 RepID=A0A182WN96_9DIPT
RVTCCAISSLAVGVWLQRFGWLWSCAQKCLPIIRRFAGSKFASGRYFARCYRCCLLLLFRNAPRVRPYLCTATTPSSLCSFYLSFSLSLTHLYLSILLETEHKPECVIVL